MKYFFILFFIFGCSEKKYTPITEKKEPVVEIKRVQADVSLYYQKDIDILVAFLWPKKIDTKLKRELTTEILKTARDVRFKNDDLLELNNTFKDLQCSEVMTGETEVDIDTEDKCYELSDLKDQTTQDLYQKVILIEKNVNSIGGEWLANHRDFYSLPVSTIDLDQNTVSFTALGSYENEEVVPISYLDQEITVTKVKDYNQISFSFMRKIWNKESQKLVNQGRFDAVVNLLPLKNSIVYQGELNWEHDRQLRRGVIYWQNLKRESF